MWQLNQQWKKEPLVGKKSGWNNKNKKNSPKEKQNWRRRESLDHFVVDNLEGIGERGRNE